MERPIDRDYARMMTEIRAAAQDWHTPAPTRRRGLVYRLTHRTH